MRLWTVCAGLGAVSVVSRPLGDEFLVGELTEVREAGVDVLVSLLDRAELPLAGLVDEELAAPFVGLAFHHLPTADQTPPDRSEPTLALISELAGHVLSGAHVAAHCHAGHGRSPALAAAVLVMTGLSAQEAIQALGLSDQGCN
ncbi:tyrosine protein phosphatase [Kineosporia sp. A_224]|uniref:protein-tyrosine phosphatase family protein n=1 Tax=Kineosporia sp. A_224 TaxID=1962180 RepID=UPI000B4B251C|nr:tyrosine protein phosphatase [Kineosporia sp. A_224]